MTESVCRGVLLVACLYLAERSGPLVLQLRVEHVAAAGVREVEAWGSCQRPSCFHCRAGAGGIVLRSESLRTVPPEVSECSAETCTIFISLVSYFCQTTTVAVLLKTVCRDARTYRMRRRDRAPGPFGASVRSVSGSAGSMRFLMNRETYAGDGLHHLCFSVCVRGVEWCCWRELLLLQLQFDQTRRSGVSGIARMSQPNLLHQTGSSDPESRLHHPDDIDMEWRGQRHLITRSYTSPGSEDSQRSA